MTACGGWLGELERSEFRAIGHGGGGGAERNGLFYGPKSTRQGCLGAVQNSGSKL